MLLIPLVSTRALATQRYEYANRQNQPLSKKFEDTSKELKDIEAHCAGIQRMWKTAPHYGPRIKKGRPRCNQSGKDNAIRCEQPIIIIYDDMYIGKYSMVMQ
mmetsp:Transcript_34641/g.73002  ORF Transcript_34641/g.73002 Transcript_34641/m.73002 type:complete len:102 (-) Transcript_34641:178-483(-)